MAGKDWLWLILAVVVIAAIVAAFVMVGRQRKARQAERAESLRSEASEQSSLVRQRESKAAEVDDQYRKADGVDPHYDSTHAEDDATTDRSGQPYPPEISTTANRDRETPR